MMMKNWKEKQMTESVC